MKFALAFNFAAMVFCFGVFLLDLYNNEYGWAVFQLILITINGFCFIINWENE